MVSVTTPIRAGDGGESQLHVPGSVQVGNDGVPTYRAPIEVPPGTGKVVPNLALTYRGGVGNGLLGVGFRIEGLSAITRAPAAIVQDGFHDGPDLDENDRFALDGQRLVVVAGDYGADQSEYRTERDSFSRITVSADDEFGPSSFLVETKEGLRMHYGTTADSRIEVPGRSQVASWALSRVEDTFGNALRVSYFEDDEEGQFFPLRIDYTENPAAELETYASVRFEYESRPDTIPGFFAGAPLRTTVRLENVQTFVGEELVSDYRLSYARSPSTGRSLLVGLNRCDDSGACLAATEFNWQELQNSFESPAYWLVESTGSFASWERVYIDMDGDGLRDIAYLYHGISGTRVRVHRNNGSGFDPGRLWHVNQIGNYSSWTQRLVDVTGNGLPDLVNIWKTPPGKSNGTRVKIAVNSGSGFGPLTSWNSTTSGSYASWVADLIDMDRDGRLDFVLSYKGSAGCRVRVARNLGSSFGPLSLWNVTNTKSFDNPQWRLSIFDVTGDRVPDLVLAFKSSKSSGTRVRVGVSDGTGFAPLTYWDATGSGSFSKHKQVFKDVTGDGRPDHLVYHKGSSGIRCRVGVNSGHDFAPLTLWLVDTNDYSSDNWSIEFRDLDNDRLPECVLTWRSAGSDGLRVKAASNTGRNMLPLRGWYTETSASYSGWDVAFYDMNGDGYPDLVLKKMGSSGSRVAVALSDGHRFGDKSYWDASNGNYGSSSWTDIDLFDIDGDGLRDIVMSFEAQSGSKGIRVRVGRSQGSAPDILQRVVNGIGYETIIDTETISTPGLHSPASGIEYPLAALRSRVPVVSRLLRSNGLGGLHSTEYRYEGARFHLEGRGFLGFERVVSTDMATEIATSTRMEQEFPLIGVVAEYERRILDVLLEKTINTWEVAQSAADVPFAFVSESVRLDYELDGTLTRSKSTTTSSDSHGFAVRIETRHNDGLLEFVENQFIHDEARWLLGQVKDMVVTRSLPGQAASQRRTSIENDPDTGAALVHTIAPGTALERRAEFELDLYGNRVALSLRGVRDPARTTTSEFDQTGRFVIRETNPVGHVVERSFDPANGLLRSQRDPNGLVGRFEQDTFGRTITRVRTDGTEESVTRRLPLAGEPGAYVFELAIDGSPRLKVHRDLLGREILRREAGHEGREIHKLTEFDERGLVKRISRRHFEGAPAAWMLFETDSIGRVVRRTDPLGGESRYVYRGLATDITDELGNTKTIVRNGRGLIVRIVDAEGHTTENRHDAFGQLVEVVDAENNSTRIYWDDLGRRIRLEDPNAGVQIFVYNAFDEIVEITDARGLTTVTRYDPLSRPIERIGPDGRAIWSWDVAEYGIGLLASSVSEDGVETIHEYDEFSRPALTQTQIGGESFSVKTTYSDRGFPESLEYPSGFAVRFLRDPRDELVRVENVATGELIWSAEERNADDAVIRELLGNGVMTRREFGTMGELREIRAGLVNGTELGAEVQDLSVTYNLAGHVTGRSDHILALHESFEYGPLRRLSRSFLNGELVCENTYSPVGNILSRSTIGDYTYGEGEAGPHAVTSVSGTLNGSYTYNASGGRTSAPGQEIAYNFARLPVSISSETTTNTYMYDAGYRRIRRTTTRDTGEVSTRTSIGGLYERNVSVDAVEEKHFIFANEMLVGIHTSSASGEDTRYVHLDHLASVVATTDGMGRVSERHSFDPHGLRRNLDGSSGIPVNLAGDCDRGFTGHEHLDEFGLINMNARLYDPVIGRMLSPDAFVRLDEGSQSVGRYHYVMNNPLSFADPSGNSLESLVNAGIDFSNSAQGGFDDSWQNPVSGGHPANIPTFQLVIRHGREFGGDYTSRAGTELILTNLNGNTEFNYSAGIERHGIRQDVIGDYLQFESARGANQPARTIVLQAGVFVAPGAVPFLPDVPGPHAFLRVKSFGDGPIPTVDPIKIADYIVVGGSYRVAHFGTSLLSDHLGVPIDWLLTPKPPLRPVGPISRAMLEDAAKKTPVHRIQRRAEIARREGRTLDWIGNSLGAPLDIYPVAYYVRNAADSRALRDFFEGFRAGLLSHFGIKYERFAESPPSPDLLKAYGRVDAYYEIVRENVRADGRMNDWIRIFDSDHAEE